MSLLMDALKQAEHAKRDKKTETAPLDTPAARPAVDELPDTFEELSLSPVEVTTPVAPAPAFESDPEPVPTPVTASPTATVAREATPTLQLTPTPEPTATPAVTNAKPEPKPPEQASAPRLVPEKPDHHNAQAAARILAASAARHAAERRRNLIGLISLGTILVIAMGSYYYYATLAQQSPYLGLPQSAPVTAENPVDDVALEQAQITDTPPPRDTVPPAHTAWRDGPPPVETKSAQDWEPAPVDPRVLRGEQPLPVADTYDAAVTAAPATPPIRITRSTQPSKVNLDLQTAYADFQASRLAAAEQGYRQVLARDANNRDARMGLAAIAVREGRLDSARAEYKAVLQRNPKDLAALAALTDLGQDRTTDVESQLKSLLAEQPQSAQLHFALANLYAEQQRWPYAQQAYFEAQRLAPEHPDYAFNLAVSLEHLGQTRLALDYYRRAIQLAGRHSAQFDLRAAQQRVDALSLQAAS